MARQFDTTDPEMWLRDTNGPQHYRSRVFASLHQLGRCSTVPDRHQAYKQV